MYTDAARRLRRYLCGLRSWQWQYPLPKIIIVVTDFCCAQLWKVSIFELSIQVRDRGTKELHIFPNHFAHDVPLKTLPCLWTAKHSQ